MAVPACAPAPPDHPDGTAALHTVFGGRGAYEAKKEAPEGARKRIWLNVFMQAQQPQPLLLPQPQPQPKPFSLPKSRIRMMISQRLLLQPFPQNILIILSPCVASPRPFTDRRPAVGSSVRMELPSAP